MDEPSIETARLSITRKFFLWYFRYPPFNPYVTVNLAVEVEAAMRYLDRLNDGSRPRVTLSHLVTAALARSYAEHPFANASVSGRQVMLHKHVGAAMPVDMPGETNGQELGIALVRAAETLSLRKLSEETRGGVATERGQSKRWSARRLGYQLLDRAPHAAVANVLTALDFASKVPSINRLFHRQLPLTVLVSNVGAALDLPAGTMVRGANIALPGRFFHVGSILGLFPIQDEVVAIDGRPEVRPVLPITYVFDHRLFDGVAAGRVLTRFQAILRDPARELGEDGEREGPRRVAQHVSKGTRGGRRRPAEKSATDQPVSSE